MRLPTRSVQKKQGGAQDAEVSSRDDSALAAKLRVLRASRCFFLRCLLVLLAGCRAQKDFDAEPTWPTPLGGMVVCEHPLASAVGVAILDRGGNAADAAVATALALAVVLPQAGNLGGGGFALYVPHAGEPRFLDFREVAPASAASELFLDPDGKLVPERALSGPLATAVPGSPAGLWRLHAELGSGKLSFWQLARPAIELASSGFAVDAALAQDLRETGPRKRLEASSVARALFYPDGEPLAEGALLVQPDLARTLTYYAREGPAGFYRGPIARALVSELHRLADIGGVPGDLDDRVRGLVALEDLHDYQALWREPLRGWFRGTEVITAPPPSSGGIVMLQVLSVLDGFPIHTEREATLTQRALLPPAEPVGPAAASGLDDRIVHWWIEALRRSFAERAAVLGDPDFVPIPLKRLLSSDWIAETRLTIGEEATVSAAALALPPHEGSQTTHLSVVDAAGNAVSLTTTLNSTFGSGVMVRGAGFLLNNEMDDFAIVQGVPNQFGLVGSAANAIEPKKRPLSSMTPTVLRDGGNTVAMVLGSPGGPKIITAVIGVVLRTLVFGESLAEAVAAPRFHQQWSPPATEFEPGWPAEILDGLRRRGHTVEVETSTWGSVQAIRVLPNGELRGASDPRSGGAAVGQRRAGAVRSRRSP